MRHDPVVEFMARKYGVSKSDVLDREKDNLALHIALGETEVINEIKKALANASVNVSILEEFSSKKTEDMKRSKKIILVKNLPYSSTEADLYDMFSKFGGLDRVIFPPTRALALAVFLERAGARAAFSSLTYKRFRDAPLYLEWAPKGIISGSTTVSMDQTTSNLVVGERELKKVLLDQDVRGISDVDIDPERIEAGETRPTMGEKDIQKVLCMQHALCWFAYLTCLK
ncbi:Multiple RNA-binding domain-containing protein [Drosera capensis]